MARRRRPEVNESLPLFESGLRLHASGERLGTLLKQRERLLADVRKKQNALRAATERAETAAQQMLTHLAPIRSRFEELCAEIAALFDELLAPGRLSTRERKKVVHLQRSLIEEGVIPSRDELDWTLDENEADVGFGDNEDFATPPFSESRRSEAHVAPAPQHGQDAGRDSLRALFKRIALAVHPDRALHDGERARRTETMKEVTRAYEDGDLARLLEIEQVLQSRGAAPAGTTDVGRRCTEVEQTLRELSRQSRELSAELRSVRRQMREDLPVGELVAEAEGELQDLADIRDFVKKFRDGKITLAQFLRGPEPRNDDPFIEFEDLLEAFVREYGPTPRTRNRSHSGKRQK